MYPFYPNLILGFHGCSKEIGMQVINGDTDLLFSHNDYDWLGDGIYFWENDYDRAIEFAKETKKGDPFAIGAIIYLGYCLDLTQRKNTYLIKESYNRLIEDNVKTSIHNQSGSRGDTSNLPLRFLDCAVIRAIHNFNKDNGYKEYDSVRAAFWEGDKLYDTAGFREKNHIQLCIRNPKCIIGYFLPQRHKY